MALPDYAPLPATDNVVAEKLPTRGRREKTSSQSRRSTRSDVVLARGLGWLSCGLGAVQLAAPSRVTRFLGLPEHDSVLRAIGLRGVASGLGIFAQPHPTTGAWARLGGDIVDLVLLFAALPSSTRRGRVVSSMAVVGGVAALDMYVADRLARRSPVRGGDAPDDGSVEVVGSIGVNATAAEAYEFWRKLDQLPTFMKHLKRVEQTSERRSHWVVQAPGGGTVEWDAEITEDVPGEWLSWRSVEGASVENAGTVRFATDAAGRGSVIEVELRYAPPLGGAGVLVASLVGEEPSQQIDEDLHRLKQLLETGEIATTAGQSSGRAAGTRLPRRPGKRATVRS